MKKSQAILLIAAIAVVAIVVAAAFGWRQYTYRFGRAIGKEGTVQIAGGTTFEQLTRMLADSGYLIHPERWVSLAESNEMTTVQGGNYALAPGMSYRTALTRFHRGQQTPVRLTFNNIRTVERLAGVVARYIEPDSLQMLAALRGVDPATFIPNTYEVYWTMTPQGFVERMRKEYDRFWNDERRTKAERLGYTPAQVSIIASIVIEETKFQGEMTQVAGVYINRLKAGIPLQADPTVKFALADPAIRRVLNRHLTYDSPYNTYKYGGLPPGPICIPPIHAIDAVLAYSESGNKHDYYYFCAKADFSGRHAFARTLTEHNRNAAAYATQLNRRGIR